jgi:pyruvate formate lyase activating enzyme
MNSKPLFKPALMWHPEGQDGSVRCALCFRSCHIPAGKKGMCQVRENKAGTLFTLNYGYTGAISLDPVEKKPLYHFQPGSKTFSIGTPGCNLTCLGCQNSDLSRPGPNWQGVPLQTDIAKQLGRIALAHKADSWSFTYNEPTVFFEFAQDLAQEAECQGLPVIWVTNGSMSKDVIDILDVSAMNIDLKAFTEDFYRTVTSGSLKQVTDNIERALSRGLWVEVTTLLISGLYDSDKELNALTSFLASLSLELPWHISRFFPRHRQTDIQPTPIADLLRARDIGKAKGLKYIYLGNVQGAGFADTTCPDCEQTLIVRDGYQLKADRLSGSGVCPNCGAKIPGCWFPGRTSNSSELLS